MFDLKNPEIQFAIHAVQQAGLATRLVQAEMVSPALTKDDRSPVTVADFTAQAVIGSLLSQAFPDDCMIAEEDSAALRAPEGKETLDQVRYFSGEFVDGASAEAVCSWIDHGRVDRAARFWCLDPIDGTKGFLRGDQYAVALALVIDGQVQIGVLGCPNLVNGYQPDLNGAGSLVIAVRGQGTWTTSLQSPGSYLRLYASQQTDPAQARVLRSFESGHTNADQIDLLGEKLGIQAAPVLMDSQAKYAVLAAGQAELMLRLLSPSKPLYKEKIWDQAAGSLVLEESGGQLSDLDGKPLDFTTGRSLVNNRGILASNKLLHETALRGLRAVDA
ncbi:MAG: 3'(2'),5'-bisphosphate nucleotidase [Chloroflexota bacterium]